MKRTSGRPSVVRQDVTRLPPPGFVVAISLGDGATVGDDRNWLIGQLETLDEPVDLVGHDWGGGHVVNVAMLGPTSRSAGRPTPAACSTPTTSGTPALFKS